MPIPADPIIFDGHNDQLSLLDTAGSQNAVDRFRENPTSAIDYRRSRMGGFGGGFFAVWVPSRQQVGLDLPAMSNVPFDVPLPPEVPWPEAMRAAASQIDILFRLEGAGLLKICRTVGDIRKTLGSDRLAAVFHIEGAEAIDDDLVTLDLLHAAGLRSLGPVWSRPNRFGAGVPFRFPATPDTGPGLTGRGRALVTRCAELRIMIDLSHITERGFWDVAELSNRPLVATHSNAHALCPATRNLTDSQLAAIARSRGMVGVNFATAFLRSDGLMSPDVPLTTVLDHLDYLLDKLGADCVGLGSDYDGAIVPDGIRGVERLPALRQAMRDRGYGEELIAKICHQNWLRVLEETWGG